ncbi:scavenger receptor class F member 1-like [Haliotis asinina]|uniref:scavenger receptor class F member 1-like n=1 Tax=Haliotis asinina TaxID=109174 RepID=UPI0035327557
MHGDTPSDFTINKWGGFGGVKERVYPTHNVVEPTALVATTACVRSVCTECVYGWYGTECTEECQGCWYGKCVKEDGRCVQCQPGYHSNDCNVPCPRGCHVSSDGNRYCDRHTGRCLEGCAPGRWGHQCQKQCSGKCEKSGCLQDVGTCLLGCIDGWFGQLCDEPCPENCLDNRCNFFRGHCDFCKPGFIGEKCDLSCTNCADNACTYNKLLSSIRCTKGCVRGWTGVDCLTRCSSACAGETCNTDGSCQECRNGYHGYKCTEKCTDDCLTCEKNSGLCNKRKETHVILQTHVKQDVTSHGCVTMASPHWVWMVLTIYCLLQ